MRFFVLVLVFMGIALWDVPGLLRQKQWGELAVYSVLLITGFFLSATQILQIKIPNPTSGIEFIIKEITRFTIQVFRIQ